MSNYCSNCGAQRHPGDRFCSECGRRVAGERISRQVLLLSVLGLLVVAGAAAILMAVVSSGTSESTLPIAVASTTTTAEITTTTSTPATTSTSLAPTSTAASVQLSAAEIGEQFGDAVWRVDIEGCGFVGSGSSFAISPNHLVTNHHVIEYDSSPTLLSRSGETMSGRVLGASPVPDVAVIEVDRPMGTHLQWATNETVSLGDPIVTLGYPAPDGDFTVTPGSVLSFGSEDGYGRFIRTDGQIDHGNSGGPALNGLGDVVGIATSLEANPTGAQLVPQIFSSDVVRPVIEEMLEAPTFPEPFCEVAGGESPVDDYTDFWTGIVASLPANEYDYNRAYDWATDFYFDTGLWADVLLSDLYYTLNPGYWAVYTGYFFTTEEAEAHCGLVRNLGYDCYSKQVSWYLGE